jgi:hypothetical protein
MMDIKRSSNSNTGKESFEDIVDGHFVTKVTFSYRLQ